ERPAVRVLSRSARAKRARSRWTRIRGSAGVLDKDAMRNPGEQGHTAPDATHSSTPAPSNQPGLPAFAAGEDRPGLLGAVAFVAGVAAGWAERDLAAWFPEYLLEPKRMAQPVAVSDAVAGTIMLSFDPRADRSSPRLTRIEELPRLLLMARSRVVITLRG